VQPYPKAPGRKETLREERQGSSKFLGQLRKKKLEPD